jgi:hypothetical protein
MPRRQGVPQASISNRSTEARRPLQDQKRSPLDLAVSAGNNRPKQSRKLGQSAARIWSFQNDRPKARFLLSDLFPEICVTSQRRGRERAACDRVFRFPPSVAVQERGLKVRQARTRLLASNSFHQDGRRPAGRTSGPAQKARLARMALLPVLLIQSAGFASAGQLPDPAPQPALPDAPKPQPAPPAAGNTCDVRNAGGSMAATAAVRALTVEDSGSNAPAPRVVDTVLCVPHLPIINWYARFLNGPQVKALTPLQKAHLAGRNLVDPFNLLTIGGEAAISVAANSHSAYGPGFKGWGKNMGVSFTQDMIGEFFSTFLIPSIDHQDPHYHRMPNATIKRRIAHVLYQQAWTQGDNGKGMVNYADLLGPAIDDEFSNLFVPARRTNASATASRYGIALATAPIDRVVTEFLPDIASHIHVEVVVIQRIIDQVARNSSAPAP